MDTFWDGAFLIKYLAIPLILVGCTAPVTHPPAEACSPPLDGEPTFCPTNPDDLNQNHLYQNNKQKREIDVWNPHHLMNLQMMFERNKKREDIEKNATRPSDAINSALDNFWEKQDGSNDPPSRKSCYNFRVVSVDKVLDGDTIDVTIDLGFDLYKKERVRIAGGDTPEKETRDLEEKALGIDATKLDERTFGGNN